MLLAYHKVSLTNRTPWWISADTFNSQMAALQAYDVVHLDDYNPQDPRQVVVTFDGIYQNVAEVALPILKKWGYPFELFVIGDYVGRMNEFDPKVEPACQFATFEALDELIAAGGRIQWHTATHRRLVGLPPPELDRELAVPGRLRERYGAPHFRWFAYPHGEHDEQIENRVKSRFTGALSCDEGNDLDRFKLNRTIVFENTSLFKNKVSVIIPNYNYTRYLPEAVDSVLAQTIPPDELIIIDDASTDGAREIMEWYQDHATLVLNESNLGIVGNFRKAVEISNGDYIAFLGADNRMRADYVERCRTSLDRQPDAAVAYTDMSIFGPRGGLLADRVGAVRIGGSASERWDVFHWRFPDATDELIGRIDKANFLHGSSMYRRIDYERSGGYLESGRPEDHDLFYRMLANGRRAVHLPYPLIEYRQHSTAQVNTVLSLELALERTRAQARRLKIENQMLRRGLARYPQYLMRKAHNKMSEFWKKRGRRLRRKIGRKIRRLTGRPQI